MTKKNFTLRLPDDLREEFMALASEKSRRSGRYVPLSDVLESALRYGKEVVQREICSEIALPNTAKSRTEEAIIVARQLIELGAKHAMPGEAA